MIRSMTGFGKAAGAVAGQEVTVELSSVNHRYFDVTLRIPNSWALLEPDIKQLLRNRVARGKLSVFITRDRTAGGGQRVRFDPEVAREYVDASKQLAQLIGSYETLSVSVLAQLEGVFVREEPEPDLELVKPGIQGLLERAADQLEAMRTTEGEALAADIRGRIEAVRGALAVIEGRLPELNEAYANRLRARVEELKTDLALTEERIAIEAALLAEKADVTEEVVRLKAHLDHMIELMSSDEPVGRRLDFLLQELHREVNTLGVKTRDSDVVKDVIHIKAELEKIREQAQNIE